MDGRLCSGPGLTLTSTGAYTDANLTSPAPAVNGNSGDPLPYAPKWGTSLDGEYNWDAFASYKGFVGSTWSFVGSRSTDFASSAAAIPGQLALPSYQTIDARIGLKATATASRSSARIWPIRVASQAM